MKATAWLDQQAAAIRENRAGIPTTGAPVHVAKRLAERFPELTSEQIGAVLMAVGGILGDAWERFQQDGEEPKEILALLCCLIDTAGEYLYAPEGGRT